MLSSDHVIVNLDQNLAAGRGRTSTSASKAFGALICHGTWWHLQLERPLVGVEVCRMHCWPVGQYESSLCGAAVEIWEALQQEVVTCKQIAGFVGDAWHLRVMGTFFMWLLSNLVLTEAPLCRITDSSGKREVDTQSSKI